ncbi:hypothetical protein GDO81_025509 [Engystomops pustulosus]|uniref:Uncharacterized protein n=1 Tax=Engystomops pustulosus TaxID=76066 RepID=A0AAV6YID8_ENGPU|nr:hypothetical protein GDO81_025509 [Engystomops pustulosus]
MAGFHLWRFSPRSLLGTRCQLSAFHHGRRVAGGCQGDGAASFHSFSLPVSLFIDFCLFRCQGCGLAGSDFSFRGSLLYY